MSADLRLPPERLTRPCDPATLDFETTAEVADLDVLPGQDRALGALDLGLRIARNDYNMYALGPPGLGKHRLIRALLEARAADLPRADDWCYVYDFAEPQQPKALKLPPERGASLRHEMAELVEDLRVAIPRALESEEFRRQREAIEEEARERHEEELAALRRDAEAQSIAVIRTPGGLVLSPVRDGQPLDPQQFHMLPEAEQKETAEHIDTLGERLQEILHHVPQLEREARTRIRELVRHVTTLAVGQLIAEMRGRFAELKEVLGNFDAVEADIIDNAHAFLQQAQTDEAGGGGEHPLMQRYEVNLLVDRTGEDAAPVVYEDHPTHMNLVGRVEYATQMGALVTDFTLIRAGALHRANGGFLILDAVRVLTQPFAYDELKRILRARQIRIQSPAQTYGLISTNSLEPVPIPLDVKVVLLGDRRLYYLLSALDPEFDELFKVAIDFSEDLDRDADNTANVARLIATLARREELPPLDRGAVARIVEHAARLAGDADRLSVREQPLTELMCEAAHYARDDGSAELVRAADVQQALDAQVHRADRLRQRILEEIQHGTILIDTAGTRIGQANGLAVSELGRFTFARPSRITASVRMGRGRVVDIEREVELGGPIHSKGVLILSGFLAQRYSAGAPLSLAASLVFEQSYGGVDGDSASSNELFALLSALAEVPLRQAIAVTGSVNQMGEVQPVGGVNEKIEGFFDLCRLTGLSGEQGVLLPAANQRHLMLRQDVVDAVAAGDFQIYAMATIDEGIEVLTGTAAGVRGPDGAYPDGTINRRVEDRLIAFAETLRGFARGGDGGRDDGA